MTAGAPGEPVRRRTSPTTLVLLALAAGLAAGGFVAASGNPVLTRIAVGIEPIGTIWVNAIRMTVVPLVVSLLIVGVASSSDPRRLGRVGVRAIPFFLLLLVLGGALAAVVAPPLLSGLQIPPDVAATLRAGATESASATTAGVKQLPSVAQRITETIPVNPVKSAADAAMLPLVVFTLAFAVAVTRLPPAMRDGLVRGAQGIADAMLVLVGWVLAAAPLGVFALVLGLATRMGFASVGALAWYVAVLSGTLLVFTLALYPIAVLGGRVPLSRFALAAVPAQTVAISSRSSVAALPAMFAAVRDRLRLPTDVASFTLPFAVSLLRVNVPVAWVVGVLFLERLYGVDVGAGQLVGLIATSVFLSFSVPGLPSASLFLLAPVLVGVGLPAEGVGILIAVDTIPDMFKTTANVTSHLTSAAVLARASGGQDPNTA